MQCPSSSPQATHPHNIVLAAIANLHAQEQLISSLFGSPIARLQPTVAPLATIPCLAISSCGHDPCSHCRLALHKLHSHHHHTFVPYRITTRTTHSFSQIPKAWARPNYKINQVTLTCSLVYNLSCLSRMKVNLIRKRWRISTNKM